MNINIYILISIFIAYSRDSVTELNVILEILRNIRKDYLVSARETTF